MLLSFSLTPHPNWGQTGLSFKICRGSSYFSPLHCLPRARSHSHLWGPHTPFSTHRNQTQPNQPSSVPVRNPLGASHLE